MSEQTPTMPNFQLMPTEEVARYQDLYPEAKQELIIRMSGRQSPNLQAQVPPQMQALQNAQPVVTHPAGPTGMEQFQAALGGMAPPGSMAELQQRLNQSPGGNPVSTQPIPQGQGPVPAPEGSVGQQIGDYLSGYPERVGNQWSNWIDAAQKRAQSSFTGPQGAGAAPGSFRASQEAGGASPNFLAKGIAAFESQFGKGGQQGGAKGGAPVPGPRPGPPGAPPPGGMPPQGGMAPPPGMAPSGPPPGMAPPQGQNINIADMKAMAPPGMADKPGVQNFISGLNNLPPDQKELLTRFGLNLMANSGPQSGRNTTISLGEAIGKAGQETFKAKDAKDAGAAARALRESEGDKDRDVRRRGQDLTHDSRLANAAYKNRKAILDAEGKALDRRVRMAGVSAANQRAISGIRKDYAELIQNAASEEEAASLKAERDQRLQGLGLTPPVVRAGKNEKTGEIQFYEIDPETGKPRRIP